MKVPVTKATDSYAVWFEAMKLELIACSSAFKAYAEGLDPEEPAWREAYDRGESAEEAAYTEYEAACDG